MHLHEPAEAEYLPHLHILLPPSYHPLFFPDTTTLYPFPTLFHLSLQLPLKAPLVVEGEKDEDAREGDEGAESRKAYEDGVGGVIGLEVQVVEAELELKLVRRDVEDKT
jgi:hypothetical protein